MLVQIKDLNQPFLFLQEQRHLSFFHPGARSNVFVSPLPIAVQRFGFQCRFVCLHTMYPQQKLHEISLDLDDVGYSLHGNLRTGQHGLQYTIHVLSEVHSDNDLIRVWPCNCQLDSFPCKHNFAPECRGESTLQVFISMLHILDSANQGGQGHLYQADRKPALHHDQVRCATLRLSSKGVHVASNHRYERVSTIRHCLCWRAARKSRLSSLELMGDSVSVADTSGSCLTGGSAYCGRPSC